MVYIVGATMLEEIIQNILGAGATIELSQWNDEAAYIAEIVIEDKIVGDPLSYVGQRTGKTIEEALVLTLLRMFPDAVFELSAERNLPE